jgi:hypothetical protein
VLAFPNSIFACSVAVAAIPFTAFAALRDAGHTARLFVKESAIAGSALRTP